MLIVKIAKRIYGIPAQIRIKRALEKEILEIADSPTYFPELDRKNREQRISDNRAWARQYGTANHYYCLYGLDVAGADQDKYLDSHVFIRQRNKNNYRDIDENQITCLRDKYVFYTYMKTKGLPVADIFAIYRDHCLYDVEWNAIPLDSIAGDRDYFVKDMFGKNGSSVYHIKDFDDLKSKFDFDTADTFVFQRRIVQSEEMNKLSPCALNTIRAVSVNQNGKIELFAITVKCGTSQSDEKDNWSLGSIAVGVNDDGTLKKYGFYKPEFGTKTAVHPDSGTVFEEFRIPDFEAVKTCIEKAHKYLYNIHSIGWDIAISDRGPVIIEGNDNWGIALLQAPYGDGLKEKWACMQPQVRD